MEAKNKSGTYSSGMSGLVLPIPKYKFPPDFQASTRLTYYSSLFNSIEINKSFYELPKGRTIAKWATEVPDSFQFTFKLWREITHVKGLNFTESNVQDFMEAINHVGKKKGALLIQFPGSLGNNYIDRLAHLMNVIQSYNSGHEWKVSVEFRNASWYNEDTYDMIREMDATVVAHDKARSASKHEITDPDFVYLRFHGPQGNYRGSYEDDVLYEHAGYIRIWLEQGKDVFVYFNNTMGNAYQNLTALNKYVMEG